MKKFLFLSAAALLAFGCSNEDDNEGLYATNNYVGFASDSMTRNFYTVDTPTTGVVSADVSVPVNLINSVNSETSDAPITLSYTVDPSSTAVEGVDYFLPADHTVTIAPGTSVATVNFTIDRVVLDPESPKSLVLKLSSVNTSNAVIASGYDTITISFQGICLSDMEGTYSLVVTRVSTGATYSFPNEVLTEIGDGMYHTTTTGPYDLTALTAAASAGFDFSDVCGNYTLETQNLAAAYTNIVTQSAAQAALSHRNDDGTSTIAYSIWFTNNTIEREYIGVYTPL